MGKKVKVSTTWIYKARTVEKTSNGVPSENPTLQLSLLLSLKSPNWVGGEYLRRSSRTPSMCCYRRCSSMCPVCSSGKIFLATPPRLAACRSTSCTPGRRHWPRNRRLALLAAEFPRVPSLCWLVVPRHARRQRSDTDRWDSLGRHLQSPALQSAIDRFPQTYSSSRYYIGLHGGVHAPFPFLTETRLWSHECLITLVYPYILRIKKWSRNLTRSL